MEFVNVTDEAILKECEGCNFGTADRVEIVKQGLYQKAGGYSTSHTVSCILAALRLVTPQPRFTITAKGRRQAYHWQKAECDTLRARVAELEAERDGLRLCVGSEVAAMKSIFVALGLDWDLGESWDELVKMIIEGVLENKQRAETAERERDEAQRELCVLRDHLTEADRRFDYSAPEVAHRIIQAALRGGKGAGKCPPPE